MNFLKGVERKWLSMKRYMSFIQLRLWNLDKKQNVTNQVASPVKFAEYLNAGLKVLISEI